MSVSSFMRHAQARVVLAPYMIFIVKFVKKNYSWERFLFRAMCRYHLLMTLPIRSQMC
jgi:hypothetical protein